MNDIELYADLLMACFHDTPSIRLQLANVSNGQTLLRTQFLCQLEAFSGIDGVTTWGHGDGITMGYCSKDEARFAQCTKEAAAALLQQIPLEDLMAIQQEAMKQLQIARPDWYRAYVGDAPVYVLQVICVRQALRGTGVFRKLMTPLLQAAEANNMPVVLQTFEAAHVPKYEKLGFALMDTVSCDDFDFACYNMLKGN